MIDDGGGIEAPLSLMAGNRNLYFLVRKKPESGFYYHFSSYLPYTHPKHC